MKIYGTGVLMFGAALQQYAISRKHAASTQRNCNDSKATLLLYYTTGLSCEIIALSLVSFFHYITASSSHLLFLSFFWHKAEQITISWPSMIGNAAILTSIVLGCYIDVDGYTELNGDLLGYIILGICSFFVFGFCARFTLRGIYKAFLCGSLGMMNVLCIKIIALMILYILDNEYQSLSYAISFILLAVVLTCLESSYSKLLKIEYSIIEIYIGYYISILIFGLLSSRYLLWEEIKNDVLFFSCVLILIIGISCHYHGTLYAENKDSFELSNANDDKLEEEEKIEN
ncbi:unnamed protein product [Blepharisma stoltei]|uniref:Uncharacterized protein n=1 Tax=Blepharisma stoltei TaxID=1481888 RepID=A0AAU9IN27_9CILI|nr:unnamed protein product [Blepharisma stoltei]